MQYVEVIEVMVHDGSDGLTLDTTSAGLLILEIGEGAVLLHNSFARPAHQVQVNDIITSVNGETEPHAMLTTMSNSEKYTLDIVHPFVTNVTVERETGNWGLDLKWTPGSTFLEVLDILEGDIQKYNAQVKPEHQVMSGCLIGGVNGVSGSVCALLQKLKTVSSSCYAGELNLTLLRVLVDKEIGSYSTRLHATI